VNRSWPWYLWQAVTLAALTLLVAAMISATAPTAAPGFDSSRRVGR
jgi:hypothetical protein